MGDQIKLNYEEIGNRIKALRKKADISQDKLEEVFHWPSGNISRWEKNKRKIDLESVVELCNYFHCDLDYLLCIHDERYTSDNNNLRIQAAGDLLDLSPKAIKNLIQRKNSTFYYYFDEDYVDKEEFKDKFNILDYLFSTAFEDTMSIAISIHNIFEAKRIIDALKPEGKKFWKDGNAEDLDKLQKEMLEARKRMEIQSFRIQEAVINIKNNYKYDKNSNDPK